MIHSQWDVFCDRPDCYVWIHTEGRNKLTAAREARGGGWTFGRNGLSFCPDCSRDRLDLHQGGPPITK